MRAYCDKCNKEQGCKIERNEKEGQTKGIKYLYTHSLAICNCCGNELTVGEIDMKNIECEHRAYIEGAKRRGLKITKVLRAIYKPDLRFSDMIIFEYLKNSDKFHAVEDNDISYDRGSVAVDLNFIVNELEFIGDIEDAFITQLDNNTLLNKEYMKNIE